MRRYSILVFSDRFRGNKPLRREGVRLVGSEVCEALLQIFQRLRRIGVRRIER